MFFVIYHHFSPSPFPAHTYKLGRSERCAANDNNKHNEHNKDKFAKLTNHLKISHKSSFWLISFSNDFFKKTLNICFLLSFFFLPCRFATRLD